MVVERISRSCRRGPWLIVLLGQDGNSVEAKSAILQPTQMRN